jgi:Trk-type K+ transport system membrane component
MLAGRLELFPVLILLHPRVWKEMLHSRFADAKK